MNYRIALMVAGYLLVGGALLATMLIWGWVAMVVSLGAMAATALATFEVANARFRRDAEAIVEALKGYDLQVPPQ